MVIDGHRVSDLLACLHAAIEEQERQHLRVIEALDTAPTGNAPAVSADYILSAAREGLRLCQAHREVLDMYRQADEAKTPMSRMRDLDHASAMGRKTTLGLVIQALARGHGITQ